MDNAPCNGWKHWLVQVNGHFISLGDIREKFRMEMGLCEE